jgi:plastocyanin
MKRLLAAVGCVVVLAAGDAAAVTVTGKVTFVTKRGQRPVVSETVVWAEPATAKVPKQTPAATEVVTRNKTLLPHVVAVPPGSTVSFPNEDPISHNLFSLSPGNSFDLGLYRKGAGKSQKFDAPGIVNVYCNVHPNMSAVIHVMPTPYYGFADASGQYSMDLPEGRYRLVAWNEQGGTTESMIEVRPNGVTGNVALTIDSRKFRAVQHKNKQGRPYQAPSAREY